MIVIIADQQILDPKKICQGCLMSDQRGLPRWRNSKLGCGKMHGKPHLSLYEDLSFYEDKRSQQPSPQAKVYQCHMGFNVTWIN